MTINTTLKTVATLDIGKVAKASGLAVSTLRYYEERGLITPSGRQGLRRYFKSDIIERLALITLAKQTGFSLDEIKSLLTQHITTSQQKQKPLIDREKLREKADDLDKQIKALTTMRDGLRHAADCPANNHFECPTFLRILKITNQRKKER